KTIDASFLTKLQKAPWLVNTDGKMVGPSEITLSELAGKYPKEIPNMDVLKEVLGFRPDVFDQLPKDCQKILKLTQGYSPDEIKEALARGQKGETSKKKEEDENSWKPKCEPKDLKVKSEIVEPEPIHSPELEGQTQSSKNDMVKPKIFPNGKEEETKSEPKFSTRIKKDIGQWGEECVLNHFKQEYRNLGSITDTERGFRLRDGNIETEVVWLNANSEIGKGYDFAVLKDNVETEYIEVKTKLGAEKELINITGTQWEFARKLFDQNQGEKYWIYSVVNAGQSNAKIFKIQNPIKLWKDGRLYAHPIQFKL
ncbi:MAG: protein NO VEIN domain-containing protein, partial [Nitrospinales bacterium]